MKIYLDNNLGVTKVEQEELTQDTYGYNILKVYIPNAVLTPYDTFTCYYGALLQNGRKVGWFAMEARTSTDADYKANYTLYKATLEQCVVSVEGKVYIGCQVLLGNSGNATLIKKNTAVVQFNVRKSVAINNDILVLDPDQTNTDVLESYKNLLENALLTYVTKASIADNLTTNDSSKVLSAKQGKVLKDTIDTLDDTKADKSTALTHSGNQLKDYSGNNIYPNINENSIPSNILKHLIHNDVVLITSSNISNYLDANNLNVNTIYAYVADVSNVQHLPTTLQGMIISLGVDSNNDIVVNQYYITTIGVTFYRIKWGSNWSSWRRIPDLTTDTKPSFLQSYANISNASQIVAPYDNFNTIPLNSIVVYSTDITSVSNKVGNAQGTLLTYSYQNDSAVQIYYASYTFDNIIYTRRRWGSTWTTWKKIPTMNDLTNIQNQVTEKTINEYALLSCFQKIGCIGDSLASGECVSNNTGTNVYNDLFNFSWGQYIARDYGITAFNFSFGGLTTRSWFTSPFGYQKFSKSGNLCDMYIIGLGVNDVGLGTSYLGSSSDVGLTPETCGDTYYGNYAKIILSIKQIQPKAKIFVLTRPTSDATAILFNDAVRWMANNFDNVYCIDQQSDSFFTSAILTSQYRVGHYSAYGYRLIATHIEKLINTYMYNNPSEFTQIEFIGTDKSYS